MAKATKVAPGDDIFLKFLSLRGVTQKDIKSIGEKLNFELRPLSYAPKKGRNSKGRNSKGVTQRA